MLRLITGITYLTDANELLARLPAAFFKRVQRISDATGKTPERVLTEAVQQYGALHGEDLSRVPDKTLKAAVQEYYRRIGSKTSASMTKEERSERARNAALAKWQKADEAASEKPLRAPKTTIKN